jgi:hypothetical protein
MKNAHERFGRLVYRRRTEKTATNLRVFLDAFVGEEGGKAHLVSVVGGDVEIGALAAAFANGDSFTVEGPYGAESIVSLGEKPLSFRESITVPGRKRPLRHLVSCSQELANSTSDGKLLLVSDDHLFIWSSLVCHYGLAATPVWGSWVIAQLEQQKKVQPLSGFGFDGVAVKATRKHLLALLSKGLRNRRIAFPDQNGPVQWPAIQLIKKPTESERCSGEVNVAGRRLRCAIIGPQRSNWQGSTTINSGAVVDGMTPDAKVHRASMYLGARCRDCRHRHGL